MSAGSASFPETTRLLLVLSVPIYFATVLLTMPWLKTSTLCTYQSLHFPNALVGASPSVRETKPVADQQTSESNVDIRKSVGAYPVEDYAREERQDSCKDGRHSSEPL